MKSNVPPITLKERIKTRNGLTLITWVIGIILVLGLLIGIGNLSDQAFLWATVGSTFVCKRYFHLKICSGYLRANNTICEICRYRTISNKCFLEYWNDLVS
jgi:hypothetical protein